MAKLDKFNFAELLNALYDKILASSRVSTFTNWPFAGDSNAHCTIDKLSLAGFISSSTMEEPSSAVCVYCKKDLIFDPEDDPWQEHIRRQPDCPFVKLDKRNEKLWTKEDFSKLAMVIMEEYIGQYFDDMCAIAMNGFDDVRVMIDKADK